MAVDDNAAYRRTLTDILAPWYLQPATVASPGEATTMLGRSRQRREPFRLVLADAGMPGGGGFGLAAMTASGHVLRATDRGFASNRSPDFY